MLWAPTIEQAQRLKIEAMFDLGKKWFINNISDEEYYKLKDEIERRYGWSDSKNTKRH